MFGKTKKMKNDISNLQKEIKYIKDRIGLLEEMFQYEIGNKINKIRQIYVINIRRNINIISK